MPRLFLDDLGVLDHGNATAFGQFAFHSNVFATVFGELIVDWLVFADDEICFAFADNTDRPTILDALGPTGLAMFFADGIMIDVAHHIHDFASHFFRCGCVAAVLMLLRDRQWRERQSCDESSGHRGVSTRRYIVF